jgi:hypothetical protein
LGVSEHDLQFINDKMQVLVGKWLDYTYVYEYENYPDRWDRLCLTFTDTKNPPNSKLDYSWLLWLLNCNWSIENAVELMAANSDEIEIIMDALIVHLEYKQLLAVEVLPYSFELVLRFEDNLTMRAFPYTTRDYVHWKLVMPLPDRKQLRIGPGLEWTYNDYSRET